MKQIIILLFSILLVSCSTRKVVIDEVKKDSLSQISTKIVTKEDVKIETKNNILSEELIITPFDNCKDIVIDGKTYRNVTIKYKKTKDKTTQVIYTRLSKKEDKQQDTKVKAEEKKKNIESKSFNWLLIVILLVLVAWLIKKYL